MLHKWNHTIRNLLGLSLFTQHNLWRFSQIVADSKSYFFLLSSIPWHECTRVCLNIHPLEEIWVVSSLELLQIKLFSISVWVFVWTQVFISWIYMPRSSAIAELYESCVFSFLRNCQTVFHRGCFTLYSHQQCTSDPVSPHSCQQLVVSLF